MNMSEHTFRWLAASITVHFQNGLTDVYLEDEKVDIDDSIDYYQIRLRDYNFINASKNYFNNIFTINILTQSIIDEYDFHKHYKRLGIIERKFDNSIPIYKYGDGDEDDDSLYACIVKVEEIKTVDFGRIETTVPLRQGYVEAEYRLELEGV